MGSVQRNIKQNSTFQHQKKKKVVYVVYKMMNGKKEGRE